MRIPDLNALQHRTIPQCNLLPYMEQGSCAERKAYREGVNEQQNLKGHLDQQRLSPQPAYRSQCHGQAK